MVLKVFEYTGLVGNYETLVLIQHRPRARKARNNCGRSLARKAVEVRPLPCSRKMSEGVSDTGLEKKEPSDSEVMPAVWGLLVPLSKRVLIHPDSSFPHAVQLTGEFKVGRGPTNNLVLADERVSGLHAILYKESNEVWIKDSRHQFSDLLV